MELTKKLYILLIISIGLSTISIGFIGGVFLRIWEVLLLLILIIRLAHLRKFSLSIRIPIFILILFYIQIFLSCFNSLDAQLSLKRLIYVSLMIILCIFISNKNNNLYYKSFIKTIILSGVFFSIIGLFDLFAYKNSPVIYHLIHQFDNSQQILINNASGLDLYNSLLRSRGFFSESNEFSLYLIMPFGFILAMFSVKKLRRPIKFFLILSAVILIMTQISTLSRGGILAYIAEIITLMIVVNIWKINDLSHRDPLFFKKLMQLVIIFLMVGIIFLLNNEIKNLISTMLDRIITTNTGEDWTTDIRLANYLKAIQVNLTSPGSFFIGIGIGALGSSLVNESTTTNQFLDIMVETGVIGLFLYLSMIFFLIKRSYYFFSNRSLKISDNHLVFMTGSFLTFIGLLVSGMTYPTHMLFFSWMTIGFLISSTSIFSE
ncbi:O-antigen ligase like membrane protein [Polynucleobacter meluiroseus]|uniref:O-antigen ligase like membrane protein n=1 Tax=Polynucleobacter meluiroseus TaxID=1938814 RepID=A0A240E3W6_9BURK|nr:O-antigen ligase family protein [Polynucleobacter meluiroseus]SNX29604.1 O-antigen ligase like membrane protein [Polynucleobacter meluiroseus]